MKILFAMKNSLGIQQQLKDLSKTYCDNRNENSSNVFSIFSMAGNIPSALVTFFLHAIACLYFTDKQIS